MVAVMARKLRIQFEGAIYHVTIRGVDRRPIFGDDADRGRFVQRMGEAVEEYGVRLYLFCFMPNHVHLLCETPRANLSAFMHKLQTAYTVYFNLRHRRTGHLMQGRFGAKPVSGDEYLLKLSRYIHLNPVFARAARNLPLEERIRILRAFPWSSYRGYAGLAPPYDCIDEAPILAQTGMSAKTQRRAYRSFVEGGIAETDEAFQAQIKSARWGIGDEAFQSHVRHLHAAQARRARRIEDVSFRRMEPTAGATAVLDATANAFGIEREALRHRQYDCTARTAAAFLLGRYAGMTQRDIATLLRMGSGSAVCRQLQRLRERLTRDADLNAQIERIRSVLATGIK
jgi:putative transposase